MFAFLDGVESRRGGGISRNGNPIGKAWHCTQAGSGDVFPTGTHVNAPSLVSCLPARLIFEHASFDAYLPSPSLASAREARNIRLRFHRPQPRTFSNGKSKYPYLPTSLDFLALLGEGKEKKGTPAFAPWTVLPHSSSCFIPVYRRFDVATSKFLDAQYLDCNVNCGRFAFDERPPPRLASFHGADDYNSR